MKLACGCLWDVAGVFPRLFLFPCAQHDYDYLLSYFTEITGIIPVMSNA